MPEIKQAFAILSKVCGSKPVLEIVFCLRKKGILTVKMDDGLSIDDDIRPFKISDTAIIAKDEASGDIYVAEVMFGKQTENLPGRKSVPVIAMLKYLIGQFGANDLEKEVFLRQKTDEIMSM